MSGLVSGAVICEEMETMSHNNHFKDSLMEESTERKPCHRDRCEDTVLNMNVMALVCLLMEMKARHSERLKKEREEIIAEAKSLRRALGMRSRS